ncbi:DUF4190 domain-containing protein [Demequina silvatica]|uniref:DUF4190 domain-containing protein n=1 Tax=Demequina silvatica TaxID=1638988 RepID=UPI000783E21A|nr:DUF4190 domain-containing protein [Demequina silvatica]
MRSEENRRDWLAIAAVVLGIVSVVTCFTMIGGLLLGGVAMALGWMSLRRQDPEDPIPGARTLAITGIACGAAGVLGAVLIVVFWQQFGSLWG